MPAASVVDDQLPTWPEGERLSFRHAPLIRQALRHERASYSDWHFTSLWSWDVDGSARLSRLGGLLVLQLPSYDGQGVTVSAIGTDPDAECCLRLLADVPELSLVPEPTARQWAGHPLLSVQPDISHHDYVYDLAEQATRAGLRFEQARQQLNKFARTQAAVETVALDLSRDDVRAELLQIFDDWACERPSSETAPERAALARCLQFADRLRVIGCGFREGDQLIAFGLCDIDQFGDGVGNFMKARARGHGINTALWHASFSQIRSAGGAFYNGEQDLGLPGLRAAKRRLAEAHQLLKFHIRQRRTGA